jgi:hypothetical protein
VGLLELFWIMLWFFLWVIWIWLLIRVFGDIFRSPISGGGKALWMLFVLVFPYLGVFVYLIANGEAMQRRDRETVEAVEQAQRAYIRDAVGTGGGVSDELEKLASLRDRGVITAGEFEAQKQKLLV